MNKMKFALLACLVIFFMTSCEKDEPMEPSCDSTGMTYTDDIRAIMNMSCAFSGCHDDNAGMTIGSMSTYDGAVTFVGEGKILHAINRESGFVPMPAGGAAKLDDCTIAKITNWVNNGTPQ